MASRKLSTEVRWRIIGMKTGGMSCKAHAKQLGCRHSVITRLVEKQAQTNAVQGPENLKQHLSVKIDIC